MPRVAIALEVVTVAADFAVGEATVGSGKQRRVESGALLEVPSLRATLNDVEGGVSVSACAMELYTVATTSP